MCATRSQKYYRLYFVTMIFSMVFVINLKYIPSSTEGTPKEQLVLVYGEIRQPPGIASIDGIPVRQRFLLQRYTYYLQPGTHNVRTISMWIKGACVKPRQAGIGQYGTWVFADTGKRCRPDKRGASKSFTVELEAGKIYTFADLVEFGGPPVKNFIKAAHASANKPSPLY